MPIIAIVLNFLKLLIFFDSTFLVSLASILFSEPPKGSFEEAQYFFEKSLEKNSNYIGTYYWLGKTYLKLNQEQKAIELFKFGVTLDRPFKREERAYQGMKSYLDKL